MYGPFPVSRPIGLRRRNLPTGTEWWRLDTTPVSAWAWKGFAAPRSRFDPASGPFRTRYASRTVHGAARERYQATGFYIPADHAHHRLVHLSATRPLLVLDLRTEANLDALDADDRISTGREPAVWSACHRLSDAVREWWDDLDGIVYRSRTTPATAVNLAFFSLNALEAESRPLRECGDELDELILYHHFTIGFAY